MDYKKYKENRKKITFKILENNKITNTKIAIIIPFRNRLEHLKEFIKHFNNLENSNFIDIFIIDQNNADKFNRGLLLNLGYLIAKKKFNYFRYIFHDVDSLPEQKLFNLYFNNIDDIIHYASPDLGYKYTFSNFLGGIIGINSNIFNKINGFPNTFFGWGGEDDSLYNRIALLNIPIYRPKEGSYIMINHEQATENESNEQKKKNILNDIKYWKTNGIKQLNNFFINIKKYDTLEKFIEMYDIDTDIITDNSNSLEEYLNNKEFQKEKENDNIKIKYYYYKIDYLSLHYNFFDKLLDKNFIKDKIKSKLNEMKNANTKQKIYQHKKNPIYISYIEPLIEWEEIQDKIINTYTEPILFKFNKINKIEKTNKTTKIKKLIKSYFSVYNKNLKKDDLFNTIKYVFDNYNELIYFRIRNNKLICSYHIYNPKNKTDWYKYLQFKTLDNKIKNVDDSLLEIINTSNKNFYTLRKPHNIPATNCLLGFDAYSYFEGNPTSYIIEFRKMLLYTIKKFKNVPDCDILLNRKDFAYLHKDKQFAYDHLIPDNIISKKNMNYWFIGTQSRKNNNLDIPIPSADEWNDINSYKKFDVIKWENKKTCAFFRGSSTGCGVIPETNPRLKLCYIAKNNNEFKNILDVGLTKLVSRIKVYKTFIGLIDTKKYKYMLGSFVSPNEQIKNKYIFNIEGNAQAYRYANEFKKNSVILNVKSEYKMWFEPLLKNNKHYIEIDNQYINLKEKIDYLKNNDLDAKKIAQNGFNFSKKYINKKTISLYWFYYMYYSNVCNIKN